jgi:hypothetical protein
VQVAAWETLGASPPLALAPERLVLHHAAQLVAGVGRSLVPPRPDDGHTSLEWIAGALVGQEVPGPRPWVAALRLAELSLVVVAGGEEAGRLALAGCTRDEAFAWLSNTAERLGAGAGRLRLDAPYRIPDHAVGAGQPFGAATRATAELARWFGNGNSLLRTVAAKWPGAAPVRVWPHHFDVGSVLPLGATYRGESPSIGIGLSPGDEGIAEPYFYATLWPAPEADALPPLPANGRWNREGWTGALLTGSEITAAGDGGAQAAEAGAFLASAVEVLRDLHARRA